MKKIAFRIISLSFVFILNSCILALDADGSYHNSTVNHYITNIHGNGNVLTFNRTITPYTDLKVDGPFDVQIDSLLRNDEVRLECDENLANYVETKVEEDTLYIKTKDNIHFKNMTKLKVYVPK